MEPAHAVGKDGLPVEVARLELGAGFVAAVVEDNGRAHALAAVAINGGHVWAVDAVVFEVLIERLDAHRPDAFGNQLADGIIHHRRGDAGLHAEAVGEFGGDVELPAADVDLALSRLAERDDARIKPMDQSAEGQEVQRASLKDVQATHSDVVAPSCPKERRGVCQKVDRRGKHSGGA